MAVIQGIALAEMDSPCGVFVTVAMLLVGLRLWWPIRGWIGQPAGNGHRHNAAKVRVER